ncbi:MAG: hypothetical protein KC501_39975 [Myxococcales bacterium]|nr:hypothetical protein [Myxococcales bacterium]
MRRPAALALVTLVAACVTPPEDESSSSPTGLPTVSGDGTGSDSTGAGTATPGTGTADPAE